MNIDTISAYPDDTLREWLFQFERNGYLYLPEIPFNYYEVLTEWNRRKAQKEA